MPESGNRYVRFQAPAGELLIEYKAEVELTSGWTIPLRAGDSAAGTAVRDPAASLSQPLLPGRSSATRGAERFRRAGAGPCPGHRDLQLDLRPHRVSPRDQRRAHLGLRHAGRSRRESAAISPISGSPCAGRWASLPASSAATLGSWTRRTFMPCSRPISAAAGTCSIRPGRRRWMAWCGSASAATPRRWPSTTINGAVEPTVMEVRIEPTHAAGACLRADRPRGHDVGRIVGGTVRARREPAAPRRR